MNMLWRAGERRIGGEGLSTISVTMYIFGFLPAVYMKNQNT
jgi:hypothetical protein